MGTINLSSNRQLGAVLDGLEVFPLYQVRHVLSFTKVFLVKTNRRSQTIPLDDEGMAISPPKTKAFVSFRLTVLTQFFPPDFAATGQLIDELVHQLGKQGIEIEVFTGQPHYAFQDASAPAYEILEPIHIKRSRVAQLWPQRIRGKAANGIFFTLRALLYLLRRHRQQELLLLTTAPPFLPLLGYLANRWFGIPYVCILYDLYPDIAIELGVLKPQHWLPRFWRELNLRIWRQAQEIVVLSSAMKQRITGYCPEISHKIHVIHSWADPNWITPIAKHENWFALRYQLIHPFTVLYSGNMGRCHDIDTILEAATLLRDEPVKFVCIGNGAKRREIAERIQQLELTNVLLLPYQEREVLPYSLTACDLSLVSVSPGMESLIAPSKLYSALAAGRPIAAICPTQSYLNQLIADARCGATFTNNDSFALAQFIRLLMTDAPLAAQMGQAGRHYLRKHFTPEIIARQYLKVMQKALGHTEENQHALSQQPFQ